VEIRYGAILPLSSKKYEGTFLWSHEMTARTAGYDTTEAILARQMHHCGEVEARHGELEARHPIDIPPGT
jgi:hypothetical protein